MNEKPKPEVPIAVLDEFAQKEGFKDKNWKEHREGWEDLLGEDVMCAMEDLATLAHTRGYEQGLKIPEKEVNVRFKWGEGVADHIMKLETENEKQKKRIAQLERDAIQQKVNYRKALENAKEQGKLEQREIEEQAYEDLEALITTKNHKDFYEGANELMVSIRLKSQLKTEAKK